MRNLVRGLIAALLLAVLPLAAQAGLFVSVTIAPPALPVYYQPPIPGPGYIWTPGYWAWDGSYYWVPGTWVLAPVGLLWTPGYWGWGDGLYVWHGGYWGPHVGFYGGVNYGFGYGGVGFEGGYWRGGQLYYNRAVTNITTTNITNVYNRTVVNNGPVSHVSFNGGAGGIDARPNAAEIAVEHERHEGAIQAQTEHQTMAAHNNSLRASVNGGRPSIAATPRAGMFTGKGLVAASAAGSARRGAYPQGRTSSEPHAAGSPQGGRYPQARGGSPRGGAVPQPRGGGGNYSQGREYTQPRGGNYSPGREYAQPHGGGAPGAARAEQGRGGEARANEQRRGGEQRPSGGEERPH